jgi:hypothetical protein
MKVDRQILEQQLIAYEERSARLHSYLQALKETTAKHGTEEVHFHDDFVEAENDAHYYDGEIARLKKELAQSTPQIVAGAVGSVLPQTSKQGLGSIIFSSISFLAGALLGSKLTSRKNKP